MRWNDQRTLQKQTSIETRTWDLDCAVVERREVVPTTRFASLLVRLQSHVVRYLVGQHPKLAKKQFAANQEASETPPSSVDVIEKENELLRATLGEESDSTELEQEGDLVDETPSSPEDAWCPPKQPVEGGFIEQYGAISPVPDHDGTDVFKWDNTLWGHEGHFRVGCQSTASILKIRL